MNSRLPLAALALPLCAQEAPPRRDVVVVTGAYEPVPLEEADRAVRAIPLEQDHRALADSTAGFLRLDSSLDLRARAASGVQGDLSIRGAGFGQTLVLLDGLRLNDAQSGHHNLDIPVPLDALASVEVLKGSGSAWYGSDAVGGVVNLITRVPEAAELRLRGAAGNFGSNAQSGSAGVVWRGIAERVSFSRDFSSGFAPDRDYRNLSLASSTHGRTRLGASALTLAHTDRPFGADQFYGNFNSWERTRAWFASLRQDLGERTEAAFAFRRHTDLFVLYRDRPEVFTNRHASESAQAALRRRESVARAATFSYGAEWYRDAVASTNLGRHHRTRGAAYAAFDARAVRRFSFSAAGREEFYGGGGRQFSPTAAAGFWAAPRLRLRAGAGRAFRLPSYTDLYYHDPANLGSPDLRPESAWNFEAGVDAYPARGVRADATVFHRRERDGIDYVRRTPDDIWRAANFARLRFTGIETSLSVEARAGRFDFGYTSLHGASAATEGWLSKYVFNYPTHNATAAWLGRLPGGWICRTRVGVLARRARSPYAVWDAAIVRARGPLRPFAQFSNISGTRYEEIAGVRMPGRGVMAGVEIVR